MRWRGISSSKQNLLENIVVNNFMRITAMVTTGVKKEKCILIGDNKFEIHVKQKAERSMANERVRELLANHFDTTLSRVRIVKGHHTLKKHIEIKNIK